jgi:uncharacterized repeat protein (TIGR03803 family)
MLNLPNHLRSRLLSILTTVMLTFVITATSLAQTVKVLHNFGVTATDGNVASGPLLKDAAGNLYGMTSGGGAHNLGTVYRLSPTSTGDFKETILYSFKGGSVDGALPQGPLFRDSAGNLYGSTETGGINATMCNAPSPGCGVVFKLTPTASGTWTETVLHRFTGRDGGNSFSGLVRDSKGNFYGATSAGGSKGLGTVYKLSLTSTGWKETVLHSFAGGTDGAGPFMFLTTLALDGLGNIYGATYEGGAANAGIVFELIPQSSGTYAEKILYTFQGGADGSQAATGVILDKSGNVYGTTFRGGTSIGDGAVFMLTAANGYAKTVLHDFNHLTDPALATPHGLILGASGVIYGTTEYALYKLTPGTSGFSETVLCQTNNSADPNFLDGNTIYAPAIMDAQGNFWGATLWGGQAGQFTGGVAWELIP